MGVFSLDPMLEVGPVLQSDPMLKFSIIQLRYGAKFNLVVLLKLVIAGCYRRHYQSSHPAKTSLLCVLFDILLIQLSDLRIDTSNLRVAIKRWLNCRLSIEQSQKIGSSIDAEEFDDESKAWNNVLAELERLSSHGWEKLRETEGYHPPFVDNSSFLRKASIPSVKQGCLPIIGCQHYGHSIEESIWTYGQTDLNEVNIKSFIGDINDLLKEKDWSFKSPQYEEPSYPELSSLPMRKSVDLTYKETTICMAWLLITAIIPKVLVKQDLVEPTANNGSTHEIPRLNNDPVPVSSDNSPATAMEVSPAPAAVVGSSAPADVVGSPAPAAVVGSSAPAAVVGSSAPADVVGSSAPAAVVGSSAPAVTTSGIRTVSKSIVKFAHRSVSFSYNFLSLYVKIKNISGHNLEIFISPSFSSIMATVTSGTIGAPQANVGFTKNPPSFKPQRETIKSIEPEDKSQIIHLMQSTVYITLFSIETQTDGTHLYRPMSKNSRLDAGEKKKIDFSELDKYKHKKMITIEELDKLWEELEKSVVTASGSK
jgi:hypothetical protein